jgi:carbamoyl-phosphate synthase large subunit
MRLAAEVIMGKKIPKKLMNLPYGDFVAVKSPMFSFMRLDNADPILSTEMNSTGEVGVIGEDLPDALMKSLEAAEQYIPVDGGNVLLSVGGDKLKQQIIPIAKKLIDLGFTIFATEHTAESLKINDIPAVKLYKVSERGMEPNIRECLQNGRIDMVINVPLPTTVEEKFRQVIEDEYKIRRMAVDFNIPVIINLQLAEAIVDAIEKVRQKPLIVKSLNDYHSELEEIYW